jgi:hypothetical protein
VGIVIKINNLYKNAGIIDAGVLFECRRNYCGLMPAALMIF